MKANELRIGNFVQAIFHDENSEIKNFYNVCKICNISEQGISANRVFPDDSTSYTGSFEPIPLTEEWLQDFEFHYEGEFSIFGSSYTKGGIELTYAKATDGIVILCKNVIGMNLFIDHVHQLQNLYFALTGEELTIKL